MSRGSVRALGAVWLAFAVLSLAVAWSCERRLAGSGAGTAAATGKPESAARPLELPDRLADFTGGPIVHGDTWARRPYTRGSTRVEATLAMARQPPGGFEGWLAMSRAGYPQAGLAAPPADVNGFYQCTDGGAASCDLLIQMRSGVHLELRGGGTSTRADVDALAAALPLAAWGAGRIEDHAR